MSKTPTAQKVEPLSADAANLYYRIGRQLSHKGSDSERLAGWCARLAFLAGALGLVCSITEHLNAAGLLFGCVIGFAVASAFHGLRAARAHRLAAEARWKAAAGRLAHRLANLN